MTQPPGDHEQTPPPPPPPSPVPPAPAPPPQYAAPQYNAPPPQFGQQYPPAPYGAVAPYGAQPPVTKPKQGMAVAAMILGLVAVCLCAYWPISLPAAITAIILGAVARSGASKGKNGGAGFALTGIITGAIGVFLGILSIFVWVSPDFQEGFWSGYCDEAPAGDPWCADR